MPKYTNYPTGDGSVTKSTNGSYSFDQDVAEAPKAVTGGYPKGQPKYSSSLPDNPVEITPGGHFAHHMPSIENPGADTPNTFLVPLSAHFIRDVNTPVFNEEVDSAKKAEVDASRQTFARGLGSNRNEMGPSFNGSVTNVNPLNDKNVGDIVSRGLYDHEKSLNDGVTPKISPLYPFTNVDPRIAHSSTYYYYNRAKIPVADLAWRKGFRHIFITRPECYIMASGNNGTIVLSEQCEYDRDFTTAYNQFPYILKILSPHYITGSKDNFNYLLSNAVTGLNVQGTQIAIDDNVQKSIDGFTINTAKTMTSNQGSTIDLTFNDTKRLDVYNCLRMWMMYEYKTYKGILAPSYNGYKYSNSYNLGNGEDISISKSQNSDWLYTMHPYDRALDYCATLFDIVTDESGTKILYWCKYYGIYPISATPSGLSNSNNNALTQNMTVNAQFKYQRKMEMNEQTFVEFNYNAGLINANGTLKTDVYESQPWLYYKDATRDDVNYQSKSYVGAAGLFTGSPYIVMTNDFLKVDNSAPKQYVPMLKFRPMMNKYGGKTGMDYHEMNNHIEHDYPSRQRPTSYVGADGTVNPTNQENDVPDTVREQQTGANSGYEYSTRARMETKYRNNHLKSIYK